MATASATLSPAFVSATTVGGKPQEKANRVSYVKGLSSFGGLKAHNDVVALGLPECTVQWFAKVVSSIKTVSSSGKGRRGGGGALSSTCNAAAEIFKIAGIMNALVLIGVAVGFVLLRLEASLEESD